MSVPQRKNGLPLAVWTAHNGQTFADPVYRCLEAIPQHFCSFKEYGLTEHYRCDKCGLLTTKVAPGAVQVHNERIYRNDEARQEIIAATRREE